MMWGRDGDEMETRWRRKSDVKEMRCGEGGVWMQLYVYVIVCACT